MQTMLGFRLQINSPLIHAVILLALALPYCFNLGKSSIWDANEAFYAETPREMMVTGDYISPQFNFQPRVQKPPFTYYAILVSYKIFGVNEFAVRLPGALAAIGVMLFSYATARSLFTSRAAIICAAISATTARIFILARRLPIDILLVFFMTGALFFLVRALQKNERIRWALVYLFGALGFLTKGPVAVIIPAAAFMVWMLWSRRSRVSLYPFTGTAIFACVILPWYVLVYWAHGWTYIAPFFLRDNLGRFAAQAMGPSRSIFYYFSVCATDFFPWSLLLLGALYQLWHARKIEQPMRNLPFGLPVIWGVLIFCFFSFSKNKQEYYIAPMYPAAAIVIAGILDKRVSKHVSVKSEIQDNAEPFMSPSAQTAFEPLKSSWWTWLYGMPAFFLLILSALMPYILGIFIPNISFLLQYAPPLILIAGVGLIIRSIIRREYTKCFSMLALSIWVIFIIGALFYVPALESVRPVKSFCRQIEMKWRDQDEAGFFRASLPSMVFYLRRPIFQENDHEQMMLRFRSDKQVFCILREKDYAYFANKDFKIYILDRRSSFAVRLGALLNVGSFPGDDLLLVSNRFPSQTSSSEGRSR
jgi:4-amino-4-deoxy-L-arabinose transferase-like glycosyltransferase